MILYFSGTGNSRYCAQLLGDRLKDEVLDTAEMIREETAAQLHSSKPWVFVTPTYSWRIPRVFAAFLYRSRFSGSQEAYFVMTCGEDIGAAASRNQTLCARLGLRHRGTMPVVMPENYLAMFPVPGPEESRQIIADAQPVLEQAAAQIRAGETFPEQRAGVLDRLKSGPVNALFYRFQVQTKPFRVSDACISCGKCQKECPLGNIRMEDGRPVWAERCTHCMACICGCPTEAIEYGRASRGRYRYQCPPYRRT